MTIFHTGDSQIKYIRKTNGIFLESSDLEIVHGILMIAHQAPMVC